MKIHFRYTHLGMICIMATVCWSGGVTGQEKSGLDRLRILQAPYPRAFFFRAAEGFAANPNISYERWEGTFERLMGIEGKVLEEEIPGRSRRNIDFFTKFKQRHPDQLVLLHYNGNARDPRYETAEFFAGHWVYFNGARILEGVEATAGETDIRVSDTSLFQVNTGRYKRHHEDIGLCLLDKRGRPDWSRSEQVQLVSIDAHRGVIRVRRGCYGTSPRQFPAGRSYAAAHVTEGPWGNRSNLLWYHNYSTKSPRDARGRRCVDILVEDIARRFLPSGELEVFDGLEFDVLHHHVGAHGVPRPRGPDCDADGRIDNGVFEGVNTYGLGVMDFCRRLQKRLRGTKLVLADGGHLRNQRSIGILNGIESEGWPWLGDWEIKDWSGGLNRHWFWQSFARQPVFNYINHKFTMAGPTPGSRRTPDVPFNIHRLVLAVAQFTDAAVCYSTPPPKSRAELIGIWDELWKGTEHELGWLGKPLGPAVRLATRKPDLLQGQGKSLPAVFLERWTGNHARFKVIAGKLRISPTTHGEALKFRLRDVPCTGPDLFVAVTMHGEPGDSVPRMAWVGIPPPEGVMISADMPTTGMCLRGRKESALEAETGASVRFVRRASLGGEQHNAYNVHPPYRGGVGSTFWERVISVPKDGSLEFYVGMGDRAPGRSDGVTFRILVGGASPARKLEQIFETHQVASRWTRHQMSLARWEGQSVRLRFVSDCGPKNNCTTDHSYWGDVQVIGPATKAARTKPVRFMTWTIDREFTSGFYFSDINSPVVDLELSIEGATPIWISKLTAHAHPDAIFREFEHGLVVANPSRHDYTFDLERLFPGQTFRRLRGSPEQDPQANNGTPVGDTITLGEREGLFLVRMKPVHKRR